MSRTGVVLVLAGLAALKGAGSASGQEMTGLAAALFAAAVAAVVVGVMMLAGVRFDRFTVGGPARLAAAVAFVLAAGALVGAFVADHRRERADYDSLIRGDRTARADRTPVYAMGAGAAFFAGVGLVCAAMPARSRPPS